MARKARKGLLRLAGWFSGTILGALGVITSGCDKNPTAYGIESPPDHALIVQGKVMSSVDSVGVDGILVGVSLPDTLDFHWLSQTHDGGEYTTGYDYCACPVIPDFMVLRAHDPQGEWPDTFQDLDTLIFVPYIGTTTTVNIDLYIEPFGEED